MKKNNDIFSEVVVGVFMVAIFALLAYFTIVISGVDVLRGRQRVSMNVTFKNVGGLKERDNVMYRGMRVGTVESINLKEGAVDVVLNVDKGIVLREGYSISVEPLSLLGGNYLLIQEGEGNVKQIGEGGLVGRPPSDWMHNLQEISRNLNETTSTGELKSIVSNAQEAVAKINSVMSRIEKGEGTVGKLLSSDDTLYNDLKSALVQAKSMMASGGDAFDKVNKIAERINKGEGTVGKLLSSDDKLYKDIEGSLADLRLAMKDAKSITSRINAGDGLIGKLIKDDALADKAQSLVANLEEVSQKLKNGDGTIGKLMNEKELYDEVNALVKDVRQIIDNYRDTTPITTFGSLVTGGL
ncbi:MAG: MCE family protein [Kiritimatiellae bacterium]|nr:MCE family protein [Kiritimatiellia bacterium]